MGTLLAPAIIVSLVGPCESCTQVTVTQPDSISSTLFIPHWSAGAATRHQPPGAAPLCSSPYALPRFSARPARGRFSHVAWYPSACSSVRAWLRWGAPFQAVSESDRSRVNFVGICPRSVAGGEARLGAVVAQSEPSRDPIVRGHVLVRMWQGLRGAHE